MDYALDPLYELYHTTEHSAADPEEISTKVLEEVRMECERVLTLLQHSKLSDDALRSMITRHQYSLTILQNSIHQRLAKSGIKTEPNALKKTALLKEFEIHLYTLGVSIKEYFPGYFDTSHPLCQFELKTEGDKVRSTLSEIQANLNKETGNDVFELLRSGLSHHHLSEIKTSHMQLLHLHRLTGELLEHSKSHPQYIEEQYLHVLIRHDYNCPRLFSYCCISIIRERDRLPDLASSYAELLWMEKRIKQLICHSGQSFYPTLPPLKQSLIDFLQAEITHMEKLQKMASELNEHGNLQSSFKTSLSVKELALFIHLQVECGIILEDKPKKVHEYVVGHYSTKETSHISEKSFKNAYYANSREDMAKVTAKLAEMLARAQQKIQANG